MSRTRPAEGFHGALAERSAVHAGFGCVMYNIHPVSLVDFFT